MHPQPPRTLFPLSSVMLGLPLAIHCPLGVGVCVCVGVREQAGVLLASQKAASWRQLLVS